MKRILLVVVLLAVVLSACTTSFGSTFSRQQQTGQYASGTDGLVVEFAPQAPPTTVNEQGEFDIQLIVHNKGAFDVTGNALAQIKMREPDSTKVEKVTAGAALSDSYIRDGTIEIFGKSSNFPEGEVRTFPIERFRAQAIGGNFETNKATFNVELCYPYATRFSDTVCIDTNIDGSDVRRQACTAGGAGYSGGQGGPLAVSAIETKMVPRGVYIEPQFVIHVEHVGEGRVEYYRPDLYDIDIYNPRGNTYTCSVTNSSDIGRFAIQARLSDQDLTCEDTTDIILRDGKAKVNCWLAENAILSTTSSYVAILDVVLTYQYREDFEATTTVQRTSANFAFDGPRVQDTADDCFPWEEFKLIDGEPQCISKCRHYAEQADVAVFQDVIADKDVEATELITYADCVFNSAESCRAAKDICILEGGLCAPGSYCGFPSCVTNNKKPQLYSIENPNSNTIRWSCKDRDDTDNPLGTCGCKDVGYYVYKPRNTNCDEVPPEEYIQVSLNTEAYPPGFETSIPGPGGETLGKEEILCLKVVDRFGEADYHKARYPYDGFS